MKAIIIALTLITATPVFADTYGPRLQAVPELPRLLLKKDMLLVMPDGSKSRVTEILANGDARLENGVVISSAGVAQNGNFAGSRIRIAEAGESGGGWRALPKREHGEKPAKVPSAASSAETVKPEKEEAVTISALLPSTKTPPPENAEKTPSKERKAAPKEGPKKAAPKTPPQPKRADARKPASLYIPPEAAKAGDVSFLQGCWESDTYDYLTRRKIRECDCFGANGEGVSKYFDPGYTGVTSGKIRGKINRGRLELDFGEKPWPSGRSKWVAQKMVCVNRGAEAYCDVVHADGTTMGYGTPFRRVDNCAR